MIPTGSPSRQAAPVEVSSGWLDQRGGQWRRRDWQTPTVEPVRIERLDADRHDYSAFSCGDVILDRWLHHGGKSLGTRAGTTVQVATDGHDIIATYQLSAFQLVADVEPGGGAMPPAPLPAIL